MYVWLTHSPRGPSGNRREWPPLTLPPQPPFPVGRKRWSRLYRKRFFGLFHYTVCASCIVTAIWCHRPTGPNTLCSTYNGNPKSYLNKTTHTHVNIYTQKLTQATTVDSWRLFLPPHRSPVGMFTLWSYQGLYGPAHIPWRVAYTAVWKNTLCLCARVSMWLEAPEPLKPVPGPYLPGGVCGRWTGLGPWLPSSPHSGRKTEPRWQLKVSVERRACEWHVSLILLRANLIAFHIVFIFQKQWDNYALERYWHSLEMRFNLLSLKTSLMQSDAHKQTRAHATRELHAHPHTHTHTHAQPPPPPTHPSPTDTHLQIHLEHYMGCN